MAKLTPKQARFVAEFLVDQNATQAAIRAGYAARSAHVEGSRQLTKAEVRRAVDEALARRAARVEVKQDDVLRELIRVFGSDVGKAFGPDGRLLPLHEIPEDTRRAIVSVEVEELFEGRGEDRVQTGFVRKVKFADKVRGIEMALKHLGLLVEKHEHKHTVTLEQLLAGDEGST